MNKILCLLILIPNLLLAQNIRWQEFKPYGGKFQMTAPGVLAEKKEIIETAVGKIEYHTFFYQTLEADSALYLVSFCDYPEGSLHSDSTELLKEFFESTVQTAVKDLKGDLRYSAPQKLQDFPAYTWRIDYRKGKAALRSRAVVVGSRYYLMQVAVKKEKSLSPMSDKFLDSFRLL